MSDLQKLLKVAEERALRAERKLMLAERKLREGEQLAPALEVLKSLTDAARVRADRLEAELRQAKAELHLALSAPDFQGPANSPATPLYDEQTGLPGASLMERYIDYALGQARRYKRKTGLVVVRPHAEVSPEVQGELIERLKLAIRSSDVLGRRQDDYLLLLSEVRGKQDLQAVLRRVQRSLAPPLAAGESLQLGVGGALAPGEARDTEDLLRVACANASQPLTRVSESSPLPVPAPPAVVSDGKLPTYLPISSALVGRLGHPATVVSPLEHLQRSGLKSREGQRWLLEAAAWRVVFDALEPALEALAYLRERAEGEPQEKCQVLALMGLANQRLGRSEEASRLRTELCALPIRIPQALLERDFRVSVPATTAVTRYTERDEAVGERHERLAALLCMAVVLQIGTQDQPQLEETFRENLERLRVLAELLDD